MDGGSTVAVEPRVTSLDLHAVIHSLSSTMDRTAMDDEVTEEDKTGRTLSVF